VNEAQIYERLETVFGDVFDDFEAKLTPTLTAKDVDGWDSLTHIRLLLTVERTFKVKFSTAEIGKLENVGDLVSLVAKKVSEK
jgi:acyl carrier protein